MRKTLVLLLSLPLLAAAPLAAQERTPEIGSVRSWSSGELEPLPVRI